MHNLDRDSILLMYIANELSAADQADLESLLLNDPGLRARYEEILAADEAMNAALSQADASLPLPAPQTSSVRKVSAAISQWQIRRLTAPPAAAQRNGRRFAWAWSAGGVAAAIIVTVFILWSRVDDGRTDADKIAKMFTEKSDLVSDNTTPPEAVVEDSDPDSAITSTDSDTQLARAESELAALSTLTDSLRATEEAVTP